MTALLDVDAERATLAIIAEEGRVLGAERARRTLERLALTADDFTDATHRAFFLLAESALRKGKALVPSVLGDLAGFVPILQAQEFVSSAQLETQAERLRELTTRRQLWSKARELAEVAKDPALSVAQLAQRFDEAAKSLRTRGTNWKTHEAALDRAGAKIRAIQEGRAAGAVKSGYPQLDDVTGGFPPTLCVICGLPGMAKSALVGSVLRNMAMRGESPAIFSLEDRDDWLAFRWLAHESDVSGFALRNCKLPDAHWIAVGEADRMIRGWPVPVLIDDRPGLRPTEILLAAREAARDRGAKAIWLDNMTAVRFARTQRMDLEIQDFLADARALADEFQIPFVVVAHAKRRDGLKPGEIPLLTDCRESAAFENLSRMALGVARDPASSTLDVGVLKNTNGRFGVKVSLPFRGKSALLEDSILGSTP